MPIPFSDCVFTLDGTAFQGVQSFLDHALKKDVTIGPEQAKTELQQAQQYGFESVHEAMGSVAKRTGKEYGKFSEIPKEDLEKAAKERRIENFDKKVDEAVQRLTDMLTPKSTKDVIKLGAGIGDIIKAGGEIVKKAYQTGEDLREAAKKAIDYIRGELQKSDHPFDEQDIEDAVFSIVSEEEKRQLTREQIESAIKASQKSPSFIEQIKGSKMVEWVRNVGKGISVTFHPAMFDGADLARDAMMLIRKEKGKEARINELADLASRKLMNEWNWIPHVDKIGFMLSIENPDKYGQADPKFKEIADEYRKRMDAVFDMISKIKDVPYIEDYFPHFWQKPEKARAFFAQVYAKRPFEGNKSFLKQRFYNDILEGLQSGLKLATDNPEEMVRLAEMNALKFKTAHDIFTEMNKKGLLRYFKNGEQPDGWRLVDDPLFKRMALFTTKEGEAAMKAGGYYMPEAVSRVVNNYLSLGLSGAGPVGRNIYEAVRAWNNLKNMFQLGIGAFHFTTTTVDATVTGIGNAASKIISGKLKSLEDLADGITSIPNLGKTLVRGHFGIKAYRTMGMMNEDVQAMIDANIRTGLEKIYTLDSWYNLKKAIGRLYADKDIKALPSAVINSILFIPEATMKPLMQWYVPRLKVGGYLRTLEHELSLKGPMTDRQIMIEKQRIWDDMDDRLGQMVYDNLFWHKSMKDLAFMIIRSFGWTGGTIRAFGKGIADIPESAKRFIKGQGISPRTSWLLSLPVTVGFFGAMYQYMMTGKGPQELEDYFFPWDGTYNPDGTKHRVSLPSYMKDFFAYEKDPMQTVSNKLSPSLHEMYELNPWVDKDFYGTQIWNPKDSYYQKGLDILNYEAQSFLPFSFKHQPGEPPTTRQFIEQKFGIMPAAKEFQRTNTENAIMAEEAKSFEGEIKTKEDAVRYTARRQVREQLFKGVQWDEIPKQIRDQAAYSADTQKKVIRDATLDPYKRIFRDLSSEQQLNVWIKMDNKDKGDYREYLNNLKSFESLHATKPELFQFKDAEKAYQEIVQDAPAETRGRKKSSSSGTTVIN